MTDADLVPLSQAAAEALSRLVPEGVARSERALRSVELIARAIGAAIDVYAVQGEIFVKRADVESVVDRLVLEYVGARSYATVPEKPAATRAPCGTAPSRPSRRAPSSRR
jgi:hypothetical protein